MVGGGVCLDGPEDGVGLDVTGSSVTRGNAVLVDRVDVTVWFDVADGESTTKGAGGLMVHDAMRIQNEDIAVRPARMSIKWRIEL